MPIFLSIEDARAALQAFRVERALLEKDAANAAGTSYQPMLLENLRRLDGRITRLAEAVRLAEE